MRSMLSPSCWPPLSGRLPGPRDVPLPEVALAPLTDPQHQRLAARRVLPGHHAQPRCELAPVLERLPVFLQGRDRLVDLEPQALPSDGGAMDSYSAPKTHRRLDGLTSRARSVPVAQDRSGHGAGRRNCSGERQRPLHALRASSPGDAQVRAGRPCGCPRAQHLLSPYYRLRRPARVRLAAPAVCSGAEHYPRFQAPLTSKLVPEM